MDKGLLSEWLRVRIAVGYLGEEAHHNWWRTNFYSDWSQTFLEPLFPRTSFLARYQGVREAARLTHDYSIGVGHVFHLFRLPQEVEQALSSLAASVSGLDSILNSENGGPIAQLVGDNVDSVSSGPTSFGNLNDVFSKRGLDRLSSSYHFAFSNGIKVFPYFSA